MRSLLGLCLCLFVCQRAQADELVLLFTSDMHSQLLPRTVDGAPRGGVARLSTLVARERVRSPGRTLLVDAGDFAMGTLFHTRFRERGFELQHMARLGYDAITLGNHDFDFLPDGLARSLRAARAGAGVPPIVAANMVAPAGLFGDVSPYRVIERAGHRIGLFGLMGKDAAGDAPFAAPVTFTDPVEAARAVVQTLREKERCTLVIALSHGGTAPPPAHSEDEALARAVPGIDVIVSGHTHRALSAPLRVGTTLLVRAGSSLRNLGLLRLESGREGVRALEHRLLALDESVPEDASTSAQVARERTDVEASYLARFARRFDDVVAEVGFQPERLDTLPAHPGELALGDLVTDAYAHAIARAEGPGATPVDVVAHPLGHLRDGLPRGPVRVDQVFGVLSLGLGDDDAPGYPLVSFYVTGRELRDMFEVEASVAPTKRTAHLQVSGARFVYNPHRLRTDRVTDVRVAGKPLERARRYRVAMNSYVAHRLDLMQRASFGLLSVTPRDASGTPITHFRDARVDADGKRAGVQELKEWVALADFLAAQPDTNGNGVRNVPPRYARPQGRFGARPSWSPWELIRSPHAATWLLLGALSLSAFLAAWINRGRRRTRAGARYRRGRPPSTTGRERERDLPDDPAS